MKKLLTITAVFLLGLGSLPAQSAITYTGCTAPKITLGSVGFTSSATYERHGLVVSSPVTATYCNGRTYKDFNGKSRRHYKADCAANAYDTTYGNWFSWCMVVQYAAQLCPSPWRVPTREDHCRLLNGPPPANCETVMGTGNEELLHGCCYNNHLCEQDEARWSAYYWSVTDYADDYANYYGVYFFDHTWGYHGATNPQPGTNKAFGLSLRCIMSYEL